MDATTNYLDNPLAIDQNILSDQSSMAAAAPGKLLGPLGYRENEPFRIEVERAMIESRLTTQVPKRFVTEGSPGPRA